MGKYQVTIKETLQMTVEMDANSSADAEEFVHTKYDSEEYILTTDNFTGVEFITKRVQKGAENHGRTC